MHPAHLPANVDAQVATAVRVELARRNLRAAALADILGTTQAAVSRRMSGAVAFSVADLVTIAKAWGIPIAVLVGEPQPAVSAV